MRTTCICVIICTLLFSAQAASGQQRQAVAPIQSQAVVNKVSSLLQPNINSCWYRIQVDVRANIIILTGEAGSGPTRRQIEQIASQFPGNRGVKNQITIPKVEDNELKERIRTAMLSEVDIDPTPVRIEARDGFVTLRGSQPNARDIERIISIVSIVEGVSEIKNELSTQGSAAARR